MAIELHEFDPVIYPFKIWICITKDFQLILDEHFLDYQTNERIVWGEEYDDKSDAATFAVRNKNTHKFGTLIVFANKKAMTVSTIAHEASHGAKDLFHHIGAEVKHHEPFEYLLGWIAKCCDQVKKNKYD